MRGEPVPFPVEGGERLLRGFLQAGGGRRFPAGLVDDGDHLVPGGAGFFQPTAAAAASRGAGAAAPSQTVMSWACAAYRFLIRSSHAAVQYASWRGRELPDQAQAEDHDFRSRSHLGLAQAVQRDRADRGEGGVPGRDALWHGRAEQTWDGLQLRVIGLARAAGRHQLTDPHSGHRRPGCKDDSCPRVPQRQVLGKAAADGLPPPAAPRPRPPRAGSPRARREPSR